MQIDRRRLLTLLGASASGLLGAGAAPVRPESCGPTGRMRAVWVSTVSNIDWPSRAGLAVEEQQREFCAMLDTAVRLRLDTVLVQVRPAADAFWPSPFEPWSRWLTGTQGQHPGYDPLGFMIEEVHARGLAIHAWFNPFRVSTHDDPAALVESHPARKHPEWVFAYGGKLYYDPGRPEVREFVATAVMDAVTRYAIDGVVFDDYFYPYPVAGAPLPDGPPAGADPGDWRRANVDAFVSGVSGAIRRAKPGVAFGISPFGIWRNRRDDPRGSATSGLTSYGANYADSRGWVERGWVDYIAPQIYWEIGHPVADYATLVDWWSGVVAGTGVDLVIGQAAYKVGSAPAWDDGELARHLALDQRHPQVRGEAFFSARSLTSNAAAAMQRLLEIAPRC